MCGGASPAPALKLIRYDAIRTEHRRGLQTSKCCAAVCGVCCVVCGVVWSGVVQSHAVMGVGFSIMIIGHVGPSKARLALPLA